MIPPSCPKPTIIMISQYQMIQLTPSRGPGMRLSDVSVVSPCPIATRPSSICTKTLITQPTMISHSSEMPACAPVLVVAISSPEPTMLAAIMSPGPSWRRMPPGVDGGSSTPDIEEDDESWPAAS